MNSSIYSGAAPLPTIRRLPAYLSCLKRYRSEGYSHVSSTHIAKELGLEAIQVRKDLAITGVTGQPRIGFNVIDLINAAELFLGWDNATDAFVLGAGNLGSALAGYEGFRNYGLNIVALFDIAPERVDSDKHGKPVFHIDRLADLSVRMKVHLGVLTVNASAAQEITDLMVGAGMIAIWNFTPVTLSVPDGIIVETVDLAASLAVLSNKAASLLYKQRASDENE